MTFVVAVEGLPGCGKTSLVAALAQKLQAAGLRVVVVDIDTSPKAMPLRRQADMCPIGSIGRMKRMWQLRRLQHEYAERLKGPVIDLIILDRSWATSVAFDHFGAGRLRAELHHAFRKLPCIADLTLFLDVRPEIAQGRKNSRTMQDLSFARRVYDGYVIMAQERGWATLDGELPALEIVAQACQMLLGAVKKSSKKAG